MKYLRSSLLIIANRHRCVVKNELIQILKKALKKFLIGIATKKCQCHNVTAMNIHLTEYSTAFITCNYYSKIRESMNRILRIICDASSSKSLEQAATRILMSMKIKRYSSK